MHQLSRRDSLLSTDMWYSVQGQRFLNNPLVRIGGGATLMLIGWSSPHFWWLLFFAWIPWMSVFLSPSPKKRARHMLLLVSAQWILQLGLHATMIAGDAPKRAIQIAIGSLFLALLFSVPWWIGRWLVTRRGVLGGTILFAVIYLVTELSLHPWPLSMPWTDLGFSQAGSPLMPAAGWYGINGVGALLLISNALLWWIWRRRNSMSIRQLVLPALLLFTWLAPLFGIQQDDSTLRIAVFDPSMEQRLAISDNAYAQAQLLGEAMREADLQSTDLIVCPEDFLKEKTQQPLFTHNLVEHPAIRYLIGLSRTHDVPILSGASLVAVYHSETAPTPSAKRHNQGFFFDVFNGSVFITPDGKVEWRSKQRLVPLVEEIPFYRVLNRMHDRGWINKRYDATYGVQPNDQPYVYQRLRIAPLICFEALYESVAESYVRNGANLLVVLSTEWTTSQRILQRQQRYADLLANATGLEGIFVNFGGKSRVIPSAEEQVDRHATIDSTPYKIRTLHVSTAFHTSPYIKARGKFIVIFILITVVIADLCTRLGMT